MDRIKITLRMGANDRDLILLTSYYKLKQAIIFAVRKHLNRSAETLSLPPPSSIPSSTWHQATFYKQAEPDVYQFLKGIPAQKRAMAIRLLLRHATSECDLRMLLEPRQQQYIRVEPRSMPQAASARPQSPLEGADDLGDSRSQPPARKAKEPPKRASPKVTVNLGPPQEPKPGGVKTIPQHNEYRGETRDSLSREEPSEKTAVSQKPQQLKDSSHEQQRPRKEPLQPIQSKKAPSSEDDVWSLL